MNNLKASRALLVLTCLSQIGACDSGSSGTSPRSAPDDNGFVRVPGGQAGTSGAPISPDAKVADASTDAPTTMALADAAVDTVVSFPDAAALFDAPTPIPTTLAEACTDVAKRGCDRFSACAPFFVEALWGSPDQCALALRGSCILDGNAPGSRIVPADFARCGRGLALLKCEEILNGEALEMCIPPGARAAGMSCGANSQCGSGYCKRIGLCGTCTIRQPPGGLCNVLFGDIECHSGLACAAGVCVVRGGPGDPCSPARPCQKQLGCSNLKACVKPFVDAGNASPCTTDSECSLAHGLFCLKLQGSGNPGLCQQLKLSGPGEPCPLLPICSASAVCVKAPTGELRCLAAGKEGEACGNKAMGRPCLPPAYCADGICRIANPAMCL